MLLSRARHELERAGIASSGHDAERIVAHGLGVRWGQLWGLTNDVVDDETWTRVVALVRKRSLGVPFGYIIGSVVFHGLELACGPGVLVPRPETEVLADVGLELIEGITSPIVVDIGCGNGAVALAIAKDRPDAEVIATDVSEEALDYARRNAKTHGLDVWFACGDLFDAVPAEVTGRVDLVVSNPPYVPVGAGLAGDVRAEPPVALFGGGDGCDVLRRIVDEAPLWLRKGGAVALEFGEPYQAEVLEGGVVRNDLTDRPRVVWARS